METLLRSECGSNQTEVLENTPAFLRNKLFLALENIPRLIVVTSLDGTIEYVNRLFREVTGYSKQEVRGQSMSILKSGQQDAVFYRRLWDTIESGKEFHGRFVNRTRSGELYFEDKNITPMIDQSGTPTGYVACGRNLSKEIANNEMKEAERFSAAVVHDLKTPLYAIQGFSQALEEDAENFLTGNGRIHLRRIQETSARMQRMIIGLAALLKTNKAELRLERVDLSEIVRSIANGLQTGQPGRNVEFRIAADIGAVAEPVLAEILLQNLLENAWKFTSKNLHAVIEFGAKTGLHGLVYFVQDNGVGFNTEYSDGLFEPFVRLHGEAEYEGLGMGLATVASIIRRHKGEVWVESKVQKGTTVWFTLVPNVPGSYKNSGNCACRLSEYD